MMYPFFDSTFLLLLPALLLSGYAQSKISSTYQRYAQIGNERNITGEMAARAILDRAGLTNVPIERVAGNLTDHYDPRSKVLRLSQGVYNSPSIAAVGIATHEVGHALQDAQNYAPMRIRGMIVPFASIGGSLGTLLIFAGIGLGAAGGGSSSLTQIGIILFSLTVLFQLITLPVEFDASRRALNILNTGILTPSELEGARKVLSAAALTYVAAALTGILTLLRFLVLSGSSRRRDR